MTPRLAGPQVALVPVPPAVAAAVPTGPLGTALAAAGLAAGAGWPHDETADALAGAGQGAGEATWLVVVDGEVVGEAGWKGPPDPDGVVEIGYGLARPARGRGLGTEAVGVLVAWTERQPGVRAVAAKVLAGNEPSLRLLRRLGFAERRLGDGRVLAHRGRVPVRGRHVC